jgi:5'-phosphate synthase pdxT subunit
VSEHVSSLRAAMESLGIEGSVLEVRRPQHLGSVQALLFPGGESTTISKQLKSSGLWDAIFEFANQGKPVMGTCAGCILVSKEVESESGIEKADTLALMDITVKRNAFGRQKESFERPLDIKGFDTKFNGIFIRAPAIIKTGPDVEIMAEIPGGIVMARQMNILALTFHPELVKDTRVHEHFLKMI